MIEPGISDWFFFLVEILILVQSTRSLDPDAEADIDAEDQFSSATKLTPLKVPAPIMPQKTAKVAVQSSLDNVRTYCKNNEHHD